MFTSFSDERRLDAVERLAPIAEEAGLPTTHLAMAFAIAHPGVTCAIIGPRTMEHLDDRLAGLDVTLTDEILDRTDELVPPGADVGTPTTPPTFLPPSAAGPSARERPPDLVPHRSASPTGAESRCRSRWLFLGGRWGGWLLRSWLAPVSAVVRPAGRCR